MVFIFCLLEQSVGRYRTNMRVN